MDHHFGVIRNDVLAMIKDPKGRDSVVLIVLDHISWFPALGWPSEACFSATLL
jgi:hypothetical protein